jgi:hypothetical protein
MTTLEKLEQSVEKLPAEELAKFRQWFAQFDAHAWDEQLAADSAAGKLQGLMGSAIAEHKAGSTRAL